jgi:hypothetical protein
MLGEKFGGPGKNCRAPRKKFLQRWGSARSAIFRAQIQKSESDHRSQNKSVDIKSRDF